MVSTTNNCVTSGKCTEAEIKTDEGIKVTINVKENTPYDFYVIKDDGSKVTLIMDRNLGDNVAWYEASGDNSHGPTTVLAELELRTNDWKNITPITYTLSGLAEDGTTRRYADTTLTSRARLLTYEEITSEEIGCTTASKTCPSWLYANLYNTGLDEDSLGNSNNGYWTSTASLSYSSHAWAVGRNSGIFYHDTNAKRYYGLRPVIELSK